MPSKYGSLSPVPNPSILEAAEHLCRKIGYFSDGRISSVVIAIDPSSRSTTNNPIVEADVLIALQITDSDDTKFVSEIFDIRSSKSDDSSPRCHFALDCESPFPSMVGPYSTSSPNPLQPLTSSIPWTTTATAARLQSKMASLFSRNTSDDFTLGLMLFFNQFVSPIPWVQHSIDATWEKGPVRNAQELLSMATNCGDCITKCLQDDNCRECIQALDEIDTRDQVKSYQTVVSYESDLLREFSFCILQKHNVFGCDATIPKLPVVTPIQTWRDRALGAEEARQILVGHLDEDSAPAGGLKTEVSWKVSAGANVAYDQFPCQNQLFYPSENGKSMWYDPVFRVKTNDGRDVWCKRHYRVRDGKVPGTFQLSVLDNGVTSSEFWTIVGAADDLSWVVFHYAGAASAVGQRYLGGLLCTADGTLPEGERRQEIWEVLQSAGIQPWELFVVDNDERSEGAVIAGPPPLDYFRKEVQRKKKEKQLEPQK